MSQCGFSIAFQRAGSNHIGSVPGASPVAPTPGRIASVAAVRAPGGTPPADGANCPLTYQTYVKRPVSPNVKRPASRVSTIVHGATMIAHTAPLIRAARGPLARVATKSTTRHTTAQGTRNDFASAPRPS